MKLLINIIVLVWIVISFGCSEPAKYNLVISNVGLFDGEIDRGIVNVAVSADTIATITTQALSGDSIIDGTGKYIIPGMVNAHVHASSPEELKASYSYGILANLNMHTGFEQRELQWKKMSMDSPGFPLFYGAGYAATVPNGHPTQFSPNMETITDSISVQKWVDNRIANGADYIKIIRENHPWMQFPAQPTLSYDLIRQIIVYSHGKGYMVVVHATQAKDFVEIAKFKPDGFVHMWDFKANSDLSENDYQTIANSGVFIIPTAGFSLKASEQNLLPAMKEWIAENMLSLDERRDVVRKLHEHGIVIVAGTDAQVDQMNFGDDYYYELEIYKQAGLTNEEILRTATGNPAKAFDIPIGLIKEGSKANMVLLAGDPLKNLENLKRVEQVWKKGKTN